MGTRQADAAFAELICADDQWLREEFEALIAANYQPPSPPLPAPARTPPLPPRRQAPAPPWVPGSGSQAVFTHPGSGLRRQRSPPRIFPATAGTTR
ncbi:MAG TPA: hypothetical protein VKS82_10760 [Streptosporangiaceae bacterium]|jgi:hypothetical protein|nr:hypothetical protein [Streptosporangiaceae bacterium]